MGQGQNVSNAARISTNCTEWDPYIDEVNIYEKMVNVMQFFIKFFISRINLHKIIFNLILI